MLAEVVSNDTGIGHDGGRESRRKIFRDPVEETRRGPPLTPHSLDPVHIQCDGHADEPRHPRERRVRRVADQNDVVALEEAVKHRDQRVRQRVQMLGRDRRQDDEPDATIHRLRVAHVASATVDGHTVTARNQPGGQLLGEGLEPSVTGRYSARAHDGDVHACRVLRITMGR
jgi:hypothetical protein